MENSGKTYHRVPGTSRENHLKVKIFPLRISAELTFAGDENRKDINFFYSLVFIAKNLPDGWYINSAPIITSDWTASSGSQWTVPLGFGTVKLFRIGKLPINGQVGYYYFVEKP